MKKEGDKFKFNGSTIIYCPTKALTDQIISELRKIGISCEQYHASLPLERRKSLFFYITIIVINKISKINKIH